MNSKKEAEFDMLAQEYPVVRKAVAVLKELSADERLRMTIEREDMWNRDQASRWNDALKKDRSEQKKELALMMRSDGKPEEEIRRYTGFSFADMKDWK